MQAGAADMGTLNGRQLYGIAKWLTGLKFMTAGAGKWKNYF
jgi:hypothetical protein